MKNSCSTLFHFITTILFASILVLTLSSQKSHAAQKAKLQNNYFSVPIVRQETGYSCGPAALLSVLKYWQVFNGKEQDLYERLSTTPENGTHPQKLKTVAREFGLNAEFYENLKIDDLKRFYDQKSIVIVDLQAWVAEGPINWWSTWDDGHYVVLIGMDDTFAYFMDPSVDAAYVYLPIDHLLARWHDYEDEFDAGGKPYVRRYYQSAVVISGKNPLSKPFVTKKLKLLR
jgi:predicted double-glycine peptidase